MAGLIARRAENGRRSGTSWLRLAWATAVAVAAAVGGAVAVYLGAVAVGAIDSGVVLPSLLGMGPLSPASVSVTAAAATLGAAVLLGLLVQTTRRAITYFRIAATVFATLSIWMPVTIPGPPPTMRVAMAGMHVVVWAAAVGLLATLAMPRSRS